MSKLGLRSANIAAILLLSSSVMARGVSPYLPLNISPVIESKIERVLLLAGQPVMSRPIAAATVLDALPEACKIDALLCRQVERYLQRYMRSMGLTEVGASVAAGTSDHDQVVVNARGMHMDSLWQGDVQAFWQPSDYLLLNAGWVGYEGGTSPTGSMLSLGTQYAQLDVGYRDHWLSPFTDSSLLVSTEAPTMPSITLSNYAPIGSLAFQYQIFLAQLSKSDRIEYQGGFTSGTPRIAGMQLQIQPAAGYALAVNRIFQFGGGARGGGGINDFFKALLKPQRYDNTNPNLGVDQEFGNQAAAITSRIVFPGRVPFSVYFEYGGEDNSYGGNFRLGNSALSAGLTFPRLWGSFDLTYEASEWQNAWYVHHIYQDGLTNDGNVIGHWFGDQRQRGDAVGGQSHMLRLGYELQNEGYAQFIYRTLQNQEYSGIDYRRMHEVMFGYSQPWREQLLGAQLYLGRDVFGGNYGRLAGSIRFNRDWLKGDAAADTEAGSSDTQIFADIGVVKAHKRTFLGDEEEFTENGRNLNAWTGVTLSPDYHLGLGARRSVSLKSDLGARIEWDRVAGHDLFSVRALDYRYRATKKVAVTAFLGAARYSLATPAYGYYAGLGAQWMNVIPHWDASLDFRRHDKVARDKLLPSDPPAQPRDDMFIDITSAAAYLSYRF